jgi:hypothetical protein
MKGALDETHGWCCGVLLTASLCGVGSANAAGTVTLCSMGPGKPVVSPARSGKCANGQKPMMLASASALSSLERQVSALKATLAGVSRSGHTLRLGSTG